MQMTWFILLTGPQKALTHFYPYNLQDMGNVSRISHLLC